MMTLDVLHQFYRTNKRAARLLEVAFQDYVAARICILNMCFSGLQLAAQAVEKQLKAALLFEDPSLSIPRSHNLLASAKTLDKCKNGTPMKQYFGHLQQLSDAYDRRYPENWPSHFSQGTRDIVTLDEVFCYMADHMPIPDEAKYRWGMHSYIFDLWDGKPSPLDYWSREQNSAFNKDLTSRKGSVLEVAIRLGLPTPEW